MNVQRNQKEIEQYAGMTGAQIHGNSAGAAHGAKGAVREAGSRGFSVDFSGGMPGNQAYDTQGKTVEDVMAEAAATDVSLQKDYMTVMSSVMSDEDFAKLSEEGYDPGEMEPEEAVTIVDTIKAKMAESGTVIAGYNDDIDAETLKKITGSEVRAQEILDAFHRYDIPVTEKNVQDAQSAMEMLEQVANQLQSGTKEDAEGVKKYLLENHLPPVLENLYRAAYSGSHDADVQGRGYFAETTGGYYGRKADQVDVSTLQASMEKVIKEAGYEVTEESLQDAAWMVETGLPLTAESFEELETINKLMRSIMEDQEGVTSSGAVAMAAARALQDGAAAKSADLSSQESMMEKAVRIKEEAEEITDAAVDKVVADGDRIDLAHLAAAEREIQSGDADRSNIAGQNSVSAANGDISDQSIPVRRQMEEVRLYMSVQVNYHLLKQGISIDTTELSTLVENLKAAEQEIQRVLFGRSGDGNAAGGGAADTGDVAASSLREMSALFQETVSRVRAIPGMPVSILGELLKENGTSFSHSVTVEMVYETGAARQSAYAAMEERYEPLMTSPMAEYGDSIKKAFRNVDDLLQEMHLEVTESNRRAVRILGYNSMELSEENIHAVKEAYAMVGRVIDKLTPAATLGLIREGVNPLTISMEELESRLADRESGSQEEMEKYSRYLYRLEQRNEITPEEKESYIGIYRLLHQIEKRDGAAIGSLLHQGAEINFKNLLTAVRNHNRGRMDYQVDDDFGALREEIAGEGGYQNSITVAIEKAYETRGMAEDNGTQSEQEQNKDSAQTGQQSAGKEDDRISYYQKLAGEIREGLTPEEVSEIFDAGDISLEAFYDRRQETSKIQTEADRNYLKEQAAEIRAAAEASEQVVSMLLSYDIPATLDNLAAADALLSDRGGMAGKVKKQAEYLDEQKTDPDPEADHISDLFDDAVGSLHEHFTDSVSAREAYEHLADRMEEIMTVSAEQQTDRIDVKEIQLACKQISVARSLAREECYEIPMEIGDRMTSVNVRLRHSGTQESHVTITMETESFGRVSALFEGETMSGYIVCGRADTLAALKKQESAFLEEMQAKDLPAGEIKFIQSDRVDINNFAGKADDINRSGMSSERLYETAKTFMKVFLKEFTN